MNRQLEVLREICKDIAYDAGGLDPTKPGGQTELAGQVQRLAETLGDVVRYLADIDTALARLDKP